MENNNNQSIKTVVITGSTSGVGLAAAELFADEGYNLVLAARGREGLDEAVARCQAKGAFAIGISTDVSEYNQVENLAEEALKITGKIDVWVNNAGVMATGKFEDMPAEVLDQIIKTNLLGYMHGARAILPIFKKQSFGILINNISIGGWMPAPFSAAYSASKFGIRGMTECLQGEVSSYPHIYVCGLYPSVQRSTGNTHSAKYSGLDFKIPPTAADPHKLATAMVKLAKNPKKAVYTDVSAVIMKNVYSIFPNVMMNTLSSGFKLLMSKDHSKDTDGNVLTPSKEPLRIYGETMIPVPSKSTKQLLLAGLAGVAFAFLLSKRSRR